MDDIERIQAYILARLDGDPQEKDELIDAIDEDRGDERDTIETAFEDLIDRGRIEHDDSNPPRYSLTDAGEVKLLFDGPAVVLAIDFIGVQDKDQLDPYLKDVYGVDDPPQGMSTGGLGAFPLTSEEWGELDIDRDEFDSLSITVVQFNSVPLGYHVILSGKLASDYFDDIWTTNQEAGLTSAREAIREIWDKIFIEFSLGLISGHDEPVRLVGRRTPITVSTIKLGLPINKALTGYRDATDLRTLYRSYASHFGRRGFLKCLTLTRCHQSLCFRWRRTRSA